MSIIVNENTRVVVQGITGGEGTFHTERMLEALGTEISVREIKPVMEPDPVDPRKRKMEMPEAFRKEIILSPQASVSGGLIDIPGDISTYGIMILKTHCRCSPKDGSTRG